MYSSIHCFFLKLHTMKTSRKKSPFMVPGIIFLRALNLRKYLMYDTLRPDLHRLYCKMQSGAGAKSLIFGDGSTAIFSHPYSVGFSSPSSNNVHCNVWRWTSMEVSSSVSRWPSFGFRSLTGLNQPLQGSVPKYRNIRCSIISVESANKSSSLLAVPIYVFVLKTALIISTIRCSSGDFSTVGPLAKDCQSNVADGLDV